MTPPHTQHQRNYTLRHPLIKQYCAHLLSNVQWCIHVGIQIYAHTHVYKDTVKQCAAVQAVNCWQPGKQDLCPLWFLHTHQSLTERGERDKRAEQTDEIPFVIYPLYSCTQTHTHKLFIDIRYLFYSWLKRCHDAQFNTSFVW